MPYESEPTSNQGSTNIERVENKKPSPFIFVGSPEYFKIKYGPEFKMTGMTYLTINTATECELGCVDCALNTTKHKERPDEEVAKIKEIQKRIPDILAKFSRLGTKQVVVFGEGEPTLEHKESGYKEMIEPLIQAANANGLGTTLFSTLTYLTNAQLQQFHYNNVSLMFSLHSLKPENYKKIVKRGQPETVYKNAEEVSRRYGPPVDSGKGGQKLSRLGVNFTLNRFNVAEVDAAKDWAHQHGMQFIANVKMPKGRADKGKNFENITGSDEDYQHQKKEALRVSDTGGQSSLVEGFCGFGRNGLAFNTNGTMMICAYEPALSKIMPNILDLIDLPDEAITEFSEIMSNR